MNNADIFICMGQADELEGQSYHDDKTWEDLSDCEDLAWDYCYDEYNDEDC